MIKLDITEFDYIWKEVQFNIKYDKFLIENYIKLEVANLKTTQVQADDFDMLEYTNIIFLRARNLINEDTDLSYKELTINYSNKEWNDLAKLKGEMI